MDRLKDKALLAMKQSYRSPIGDFFFGEQFQFCLLGEISRRTFPRADKPFRRWATARSDFDWQPFGLIPFAVTELNFRLIATSILTWRPELQSDRGKCTFYASISPTWLFILERLIG